MKTQTSNDSTLSYGQQALWYLNQLEPHSTAYHLGICLRLTGYLDSNALAAAWIDIGNAHPQLRARFMLRSGQPSIEFAPVPATLQLVDGSPNDLDRFWRQIAGRPFNLECEAPARALLLRETSQSSYLLLCMHHLVGDLWSSAILLRELSASYAARASGSSPAVFSEEMSYDKFTAIENNWLGGLQAMAAWDFWRAHLEGVKTEPILARRVGDQSAGEVPVVLNASLSTLIQRSAREHETTPYSVLLAGYARLLGEETGRDELVIGTPATIRAHSALRNTVGYLVNAVPIRCPLGQNGKSVSVIAANARKALAHRRFPFSMLVERLRMPRTPGMTPLFQTMFAYQSLPRESSNLLPLALSPQRVRWAFGENIIAEITAMPPFDPQFPLTLTLGRQDSEFSGCLQFDGCRVTRTDALRIANRFPELLAEFLGTQKPGSVTVPRPNCDDRLEHLFDETACRMPNAVAMSEQGRNLTYAQVKIRAENLSSGLHASLAGRDGPVALQMSSCAEACIIILAILKSGRAFLPLDPSEPPVRRNAALLRTGACALISPQGADPGALPNGIALVFPEKLNALASPEVCRKTHSETAYLIFTSGSTGEPKAVEVGHSAIINHARAMARLCNLSPQDRVLQFHTLGFDAAFEEIFPAWTAGARIVFEPQARELGIAAFLEMVARNKITVLNLPTSYWHALTEEAVRLRWRPDHDLRLLIVGGERASEKIYAAWRKLAPRCRWVNTYGPTEATVTALTFEPLAGAPVQGSLPIGRPIDGVIALLLDENGKLASSGEGELILGGAGLALGYRADPETTAGRFIIRTIAGESQRFYRTGDRVKLRPDGNFEYLGRLDRQLKIRGHRVDPEEIERTLHAHPLIEDVAVVPQVSKGDTILTGWIVRSEASLTERILRTYLAQRLPFHLIPSRLNFVERIPRKPSGKIDRAKLVLTGKRHSEESGPQKLAALFSELLGHKIGSQDDFFLYGGHSLLAIRLLGRIESRYGVRLSVSDFMAAPTANGLWAILQAAPRVNASNVPAPLPAETIISAQQKRAFFAHETGRPFLANIVLLLRIAGRIDEVALANALKTVARRKFLLHFGFRKTTGGIIACKTTEIPDLECRTLRHDNFRDAVVRLAKEESVKPFAFDGRTPWFRLLLVSTPKSMHQHLIVITHHAVADGWALELLLNELRTNYEQTRPGCGQAAEFEEDYQAYAFRQAQWLTTSAASAQMRYWKKRLSGAEEPWLPFRLPATPGLSWQTECHRLTLPLQLSRRLRRGAASQGITLFALLMASFKAHIHRFAGQTDIMLGTVVSNRATAAEQNIFGPLQNPVFIRDEVTSDLSMRELSKRVARSLAEAQEHGALPIEQVLREASPHRPATAALEGGIQFLSHDYVAPKLRWGSAVIHPVEIGLEESPFALSIAVSSISSRVQIVFTYRSEACSGSGIRNLARQYATLLQSVAADLDVTAGGLNLLPADEGRRFARGVSRDHHARAELLHAGFESQVRKHPNALAVVSGNQRLTYGELNSRSDATAQALVQKGLKAGGLVAIILPRGWEQAVACLAVLKAGGVYVPVDPSLPPTRLKAIFQQGKFHAAIVSDPALCQESWAAGLRSVVTIASRADIAGPVHRARIKPDALAYVIFTSGSTGVPKGVMIQHQAAMTTIAEINRRFQIRSDDRALAVSALGFDLSVFDLFGIFRAGGTVVMPRSQDPREWLEQILSERVTIWNSVPCLFELLLDEAAAQGKRLETLRLILLSGDFIPLALARRIRETLPQARLIALGGATEGAIWSIGHEVKQVDPTWRSVPYGRALRNQEMFVLDRRLDHCPTGVKGELYIAGAGLARGYWRNSTETKHRFLVHPRWKIRLYRTGDQGRYLENGEIEILGRLDEQVKINGFRVEFGEIEVALRSMPFIRQAMAEIRTDASGNKRVVAFAVASNGVGPAVVLDRLRRQLPAAMVPATCVVLNQLPLTANGKVDRQHLRTMVLPATSANGTASPENSDEHWILELWKSLLGDVQFGVEDDFFTVGGHSLLAIKMLQQVRSHFEVDLPLTIVVESPTIRSLAAAVKSASGKDARTGLTRRATSELEADSEPFISKPISKSGRGPSSVFLTGATGHLGLALLVELLQNSNDHIYCLIRSSSREEGEGRITAALQSQGFQETLAGRLTVIPGDLRQAQFGLDSAAFDELAVNVHAIYHCAAEVNFITTYEKLVAGNVEAVREMIRLASLGGAVLHHVSSVAVFPYGSSQIRYEDEDIAQIKTLMGGYAQSKWVAERMVWKAIRRGLNAVIYRPAQIVGRQSVHSRQDIFDYILRACHTLRAIPDVAANMDMITSDFAARAIRIIASRPSSWGKAFHLVHPAPLPLRDFVRQLSIPLPIIPLGSWLELLDEKVRRSDDSALHFISMLVQGLDPAEFTPPTFDCRKATRCLNDSGMVCPPMGRQFIPRELTLLEARP